MKWLLPAPSTAPPLPLRQVTLKSWLPGGREFALAAPMRLQPGGGGGAADAAGGALFEAALAADLDCGSSDTHLFIQVRFLEPWAGRVPRHAAMPGTLCWRIGRPAVSHGSPDQLQRPLPSITPCPPCHCR